MVTKITSPVTPLEVIGKVNEIIDDFTLDNLTNVSISSPSAGQNLTYDATNQLWKNTSSSATVAWGGITGTLSDQSDLNNALNGKQDTLTAGDGIDITNNTISMDKIFWVTYGTTPYNDIVAAWNAGKIILMLYSSGSTDTILFHCQRLYWSRFYFNSTVNSNLIYNVTLDWNNNWYLSALTLQSTSTSVTHTANTAVGSSTQPVYVASDGTATACNAYPTVDQTYDGTSTNAQSGVAVASALSGYVPTSRTVNGKALSSNISLSASDVGALPDSTVIPTVNNATLTITQGGTTKGTFTANASSNVTIDLDSGGGSVDVDNSTITLNSSDQIQTVAVKDNRSGNAIKTWTGTRQQYDAITTKDSNTLYNITDDSDVTLTLLNTLYPVGAIYIGTMNACPLQALGVGTWTLVSSGRVLQGVSSGQTVGSTIEAGLPNITGNTGINVAGYNPTGCFFADTTVTNGATASRGAYGSGIGINASTSSSIYGNSNTVQPPAYLVNIWERIQ